MFSSSRLWWVTIMCAYKSNESKGYNYMGYVRYICLSNACVYRNSLSQLYHCDVGFQITNCLKPYEIQKLNSKFEILTVSSFVVEGNNVEHWWAASALPIWRNGDLNMTQQSESQIRNSCQYKRLSLLLQWHTILSLISPRPLFLDASYANCRSYYTALVLH